MARPTKNSCDYFPHDRDMRNHKKIKAIRQKFGITGYGIWVMLLELLTGSDGNVLEDSEIELELISGDFGVEITDIRDVLDYCYKLELLFNKEGFISSESLDERLKPVYEKRKVAKEASSKQKRKAGKFSNNTEDNGKTVTVTTEDNEVNKTEKPQIRVNNSKVNNSKLISDTEDYKIYTFYDVKSIYENSTYENQSDDIKEKYTKACFDSYLWFLSLFKEFKKQLSNKPFPLLRRYCDDIYSKFTKEEIESGAKKIQSLGINGNADFVFRLIDCIGFATKNVTQVNKATDVNAMNELSSYKNMKDHMGGEQSFKKKESK